MRGVIQNKSARVKNFFFAARRLKGNMDKIRLTNVQVYGYHGVFPHEKEAGQLFRVDVELSLDLSPAGKSDDLAATVDYVAVYRTILEVFSEKKANLVEHVAERLAEKLLCFSSVKSAKIVIHKPHVPVEKFSGQFSIEIVRNKG